MILHIGLMADKAPYCLDNCTLTIIFTIIKKFTRFWSWSKIDSSALFFASIKVLSHFYYIKHKHNGSASITLLSRSAFLVPLIAIFLSVYNYSKIFAVERKFILVFYLHLYFSCIIKHVCDVYHLVLSFDAVIFWNLT